MVHIAPPRGPKTTAGRTALAIVVRSEVNEEIQQRVDATLVIEPFFELTTTLEPVEIEGKRGGYTYVNVENRGNKVERLTFVGSDPGKRLRFSFRPAELEVRAGQRRSVGVDVRARRRVWGGAEKPRQFRGHRERCRRTAGAPSAGTVRAAALVAPLGHPRHRRPAGHRHPHHAAPRQPLARQDAAAR